MAADYTLSVKILPDDLDRQLKVIQKAFKFDIKTSGGDGGTSEVVGLEEVVAPLQLIGTMMKSMKPLKMRVFEKLEKFLDGMSMMKPPEAPRGHYDLETQSWTSDGEEESVDKSDEDRTDDNLEMEKERSRKEMAMEGFGKLREILGGIDKKQMALTGISFAVGGIFGLFTEASGILKSTLKLITTGIMLMLKPIGDVIGMILRPILVVFYQAMIIPFIRTIYPQLTKLFASPMWNAMMGNLADNIEGAFLTLEKLYKHFTGQDTSEVDEKLEELMKKQEERDKRESEKADGPSLESVGPVYYGPEGKQGEYDDEFNPFAGLQKWWEETFGGDNTGGNLLPEAHADTGTGDVQGPVELTDEIPKTLAQVGETFSGIGAIVKQDVDSVLDAIIDPIRQFGENLLGPKPKQEYESPEVNEHLVMDPKPSPYGISPESIGAPGQGGGEDIPLTLGMLGEKFTEAGDTISADMDAVSTQFTTMSEETGENMGQAWAALTGWFSGVQADTNDKLKTDWTGITSWFADVAKGIPEGIGASWNMITRTFLQMMQRGMQVMAELAALIQKARGVARELRASGGGGGPVKKMATGGIIDEPIYGMGLNSGRQYLMGERGPERITPLGQTKTEKPARNITINIHSVGNQAQLDTMIQRVKQEIALDDKRIGVV